MPNNILPSHTQPHPNNPLSLHINETSRLSPPNQTRPRSSPLLVPPIQPISSSDARMPSYLDPPVAIKRALVPLPPILHPLLPFKVLTGWKSVCVNPGVTRRMLGVPRLESDTILDVLFLDDQ
ncbi:hypothetical protein P692DRAFT_201868880 [Suillus brevipes Sb2]|nr:hypothetical protein P692DRAFT_201868880 [Suillus brevipes Sb2]